MAAPALVAVDLGLRTGLAVYGDDGRLQRYRSQNFGTRSRLRRGAGSTVRDMGTFRWLVVEGDATLARIWERAAARQGAECLSASAERWRSELLHPSERRHGQDAKEHADRLARLVIDWSGAPRPTALRHDAAEAILLGLWGCLQVGLLAAVPPQLRLDRR